MFQFPGFAPRRVSCLQHDGLPHSEIFGSIVVCTSPKLIAAYHVLLRLKEPRHPPYTLIYFFTFLNLVPNMSKNFADSFSLVLIFYIITFVTIVENNGFEPLTPCVQGRCSSQLS